MEMDMKINGIVDSSKRGVSYLKFYYFCITMIKFIKYKQKIHIVINSKVVCHQKDEYENEKPFAII